MKKIVFSIFLVLLCLCVFSVVLTEKPINFNTLEFFVNTAPEHSINISQWVDSVIIPLITDDWNTFNSFRDFFNSCIGVINIVWRPLAFICGGIYSTAQFWIYVTVYFFS